MQHFVCDKNGCCHVKICPSKLCVKNFSTNLFKKLPKSDSYQDFDYIPCIFRQYLVAKDNFSKLTVIL